MLIIRHGSSSNSKKIMAMYAYLFLPYIFRVIRLLFKHDAEVAGHNSVKCEHHFAELTDVTVKKRPLPFHVWN